eukprot:IDg12683t1
MRKCLQSTCALRSLPRGQRVLHCEERLTCTTVRVRLAFYSRTLSPLYGYLRASVREPV